jgi:hypothetical protein
MTKRNKPFLVVILHYKLPQEVFDAVEAYLDARAKKILPDTPSIARAGMTIERGLITTVKSSYFSICHVVLQDVEKIVAKVAEQLADET